MNNLECSVCLDYFNTDDREPHTINCGHSFCRKCLINVISNGLFCPECRHEITYKSIDEIPVSITLRRLCEKENNKNESANHNHLLTPTTTAGICEKHEKIPIQFYCCPCKQSICSTCALISHPSSPAGSCNVMSITEAIKRIKSEHNDLAELFDKSINSIKVEVKNILSELENVIQGTEKKIKHIKTVLHVETEGSLKFNIRRQKLEKFLSHINTQEEIVSRFLNSPITNENFEMKITYNEAIKETVMVGDKLLKDCNEEVNSYNRRHQAHKNILRKNLVHGIQLSRPLYCEIKIYDHKRWARVTVEQNYLVMHSFEKTPPESDATIMQYSDAVKQQDKISFAVLDICWNSSYKGRVTIKLNEGSKRAQNFKLLCTGEKGKTYKGTKFHEVKYKESIAEQIKGGDYEKNDGSAGCPLLSDMVDKELQTSPRMEGIVYTTNPKKYNMQSQFGICLKEDKNQVFFGYFGSVKSGLGILKEACKHMYEGVYIMDCGVLLDT